jgi:outer membrane receptor protein involved in Fe transport
MTTMRNRILLPVLLLVLGGTPLLAQTGGKIAGTVRDKATGAALPGVNILLRGTRLGGTTGADGSYFILNVPSGSYSVAASLVGYTPVTQQRVIVHVGRTTAADFTLQESAVEGQEVLITADRPDVVREKTSTSDLVRAEEVANVAGIRDLTDVLSLSTDVSEGHFRGGREGEELYNLQGMGIVNPLTGIVTFAPIMSAVEEVEVITSGFGAQYGNAQSGVVNIVMKEGGSDRWRTRGELRTRAPGYKHFGANVFDPGAQPYLRLLDSPEKWLGSADDSIRYYSTVGNGFDNRYGRDSVTLSQIAHSLWAYQGRRDAGRVYNNLWDYSTDITIGGPLSPVSRLFLAAHLEEKWLYLPTPEPDRNRQVMGNIVFDVGPGMALRFSGAYSRKWTNVLRSRYTNGFYNWIWDRVLGINLETSSTVQLGARFSHAISPQTYYELKLNTLSTSERNGSPVMDPVRYPGNYSKLMWIPYTATPDQFGVGNRDDNFGRERTLTASLDASLTSQVTASHLLHAGIQANLYNLDVANRTSIASAERVAEYTANPFEIALYAQDKMEFEGMIANMGLRLDVWNMNVDYYTDRFSPFRVVVNESTVVYDRDRAPRESTPTLARLQPRLGISFPVSVSTVFHMNYGSFVQRPPFSRTIATTLPALGFARMQLGNPRLEPEATNSYDVGITQGLGDGFTLDVSGYYKDVKNLLEQAIFYDNTGNQYITFVNRDYADVRGFRAALTKRRGIITGSLNYTFMVATGKASTPFDASPIFSEDTSAYPEQLPGPADITLDFDRTHNLVLNVAATTPEEWGPELLGARLLEQFTVSVTSTMRSGRPYTYDRQGTGIVNNKRTPMEYTTNLRVTKKFDRAFGVGLTFYGEVFNLFNQKIYSYNAVFQKPVSTTGSTFINRNIEKFENDPGSLQYFDDFQPFLVDQTFLLYANSPRAFSFGLVVNL